MSSRFQRTRENFTCAHCGRMVRGNGYTNHCPSCLWSRHVDVEPGDRAATCEGLMEPIAALVEGDGTIVVQRCVECGRVWRNRCAANDNRDALLTLFGSPAPDTSAKLTRGQAARDQAGRGDRSGGRVVRR
jgi:RNHCP domain